MLKLNSGLLFKGKYMKLVTQKVRFSKPEKLQKFFDKKIGGEIVSIETLTANDFLLSPQNAAKYLDVSVKFIYELMQSGQIESIPVGGRLKRIRKRTLDHWLSLQAMKFER